VCGGRGICGRCQVLVSEGEFPKHGLTSKLDHLTPFGKVEEDYCVTQPLVDGRRLSCAAQVLGDVVIDVPSSSQVHKQVVRKEAEAHDVELDPLIRLWRCSSPICTTPAATCAAWRTRWNLNGA